MKKIKDGFAVVQLAHDTKVIDVALNIAEAQTAADKAANLGYGVIVLPVAYAAILDDQRYSAPNYK